MKTESKKTIIKRITKILLSADASLVESIAKSVLMEDVARIGKSDMFLIDADDSEK